MMDAAEQEFLGSWRLDPAAFTVVLVSRLAKELKLEGILAAIECVELLSKNSAFNSSSPATAQHGGSSKPCSRSTPQAVGNHRTHRRARGSSGGLHRGRCCPRNGRVGPAGAGLCKTTDRSRRKRVLGTPNSAQSSPIPRTGMVRSRIRNPGRSRAAGSAAARPAPERIPAEDARWFRAIDSSGKVLVDARGPCAGGLLLTGHRISRGRQRRGQERRLSPGLPSTKW